MAEYHALLLLTRELLWELRRKCYDKIHDEQLDEINRRVEAAGLTQND